MFHLETFALMPVAGCHHSTGAARVCPYLPTFTHEKTGYGPLINESHARNHVTVLTHNARMDRTGDDLAGFSVRYDPVDGRTEVTGWGFWSVEVATNFATKVMTALRERPEAKALLLDLGELKPMREEGQKSFANLLRALPALGITRTHIVTTSSLTKMQLMRIATETGTSATIQWINSTNALARS
jgi:hypothetical protein